MADALALRSTQARLRGDHALADLLHDEAERAYLEERWAYELEAARRWVPGEKHQAIDRVALDRQRRRQALADFAEWERAERAERVSKFCVSDSPSTQNLDIDQPKGEKVPAHRCGIWRFGRASTTGTMAYHVACKRRGCVECRPQVIAEKVAAVPDVDLYAIEIPAERWPAMQKRLSRARKAETPGEYVRIPRADGLVLVVSDAPVGRPIERAIVAQVMESTPTTHGNITASPAWRVETTQAPEGFVDEGVMTSRVEWVVETAERKLGRPPRWERRRGRIYFGELTDEEHQMIRLAGQVMTDEEHRRAVKGAASGTRLAQMHRSGRRPIGAEVEDAVARLRDAGVRYRRVS